MTRQFNQQIHCPNCRCWITHETSFGRWIRENKELDSAIGYCVTDQDYWIHKFKTYGNRDFQCLMMVEIKTMGAALSDAQKDTLYIINQITRNRAGTPTKELKFQSGKGITKVYSIVNRKNVVLRAFGAHVLTFSGLGPGDSEWIKWNLKQIDIETLTSLLKFDLDPDTLRPIDLRNHHNPNKNQLELPLELAS